MEMFSYNYVNAYVVEKTNDTSLALTELRRFLQRFRYSLARMKGKLYPEC